MAEKDIMIEAKESGEIKIATEVISAIATQAISQIKGVSSAGSVVDGFVDLLVKKAPTKGVKIVMDEEKNADVDVHIAVDYGMNIMDASWEIQEAVKRDIESMTDISVKKINVYVDGVTILKEPKPEKPVKAAKPKKEAAPKK